VKTHKISEIENSLKTTINKPIKEISQKHGELILWFGNSKEYCLQINTQFRFVLGQDILLGQEDIFLPCLDESTKPGFKLEQFNYAKENTTRYAQQIDRFFNENLLTDYVVEGLETEDFGDFTLIFKNDVKIEVKSDIYNDSTSDDADELWRLSKGDENIILFTSAGIERNKLGGVIA
jgi:hypothetical protein